MSEPVLVWNDECEGDNILNVPYRIMKGMTNYPAYMFQTGEYGIRPAATGRGNAMFINTVDAGDWNKSGGYGMFGAEAPFFGKTFGAIMNTLAGYPNIWLSFVFKIVRTPTNAVMKPKVPLFTFGNQHYDHADFAGTGKYGWGVTFSLYQADSGDNIAGDLVIDMVRGGGFSSGDPGWIPSIDNYKIANINCSDPHRIVLQFTSTNINSGIQTIDVRVDDGDAVPIVATVSQGTITSNINYYMGAGAISTYSGSYGFPRGWDGYGQEVYCDFEVDDVIVWTGPAYYEYNWRGETVIISQVQIPWWLILAILGAGALGYYASRQKKTQRKKS